MDFEGLDEATYAGWRQFITDCEGPITKNDNAFEICKEYIEKGEPFYNNISKYDDVLSDVVHRQGYKAGDTLRLVLPFLKAYGATDTGMVEFSRKNLVTVPGAKKTMRFVQEFLSCFIVSTSYEHYIIALSEAINFPLENIYYTSLDLDSVRIDNWEKETLKRLAKEIAGMPSITIPEGSQDLSYLSPTDRKTVSRLDEIFWEEMTDMSTYQLVLDINPVGGDEKASSILDIRRRTGIGLDDTMYIGNGITDMQALQLVKEGGGLGISFNGNQYALREAEVAIVADNTVVTSVLAETFNKAGSEGVWNLVDDWTLENIKKSGHVHEYLVRELEKTYPKTLPTVSRITPKNVKQLAKKSLEIKKTLKGEVAGTPG